MKKKKEQQYTQTAEYFAKFTGNFTLSAVIKATIEEVIALAEQRTKKKIKDMVVLDVGSGFGAYSFELEKYAKKVIGVEPDPYAYNIATKEAKARKSHVTF